MLDDEKIFNDEQIGVDPHVAKKINKKRPIINSISFVKKHKMFFIIFTLLLAILVVIFFLLPEIKINNTILTNLNSQVRLEKGQIAKLKDRDVSAEIVNFVNDQCPENQTCFWSGQAVQYTLTVNGQKYATGSTGGQATSSGYRINTKESDYKTYALISIEQNEN